MATILFQAAGAALGGVFGPVGAIIGRAAGALAGNVVDRALINGTRTISGQRLATARIPGADDGTSINRLYGTARIGGTLIWATRFEEEVSVERAGGKATGPRVENFRYYANLAIGLCEGEIASVRRVWADGREIDLTNIEMRVHNGSRDQLPDPLIEAKQGTGKASGCRSTPSETAFRCSSSRCCAPSVGSKARSGRSPLFRDRPSMAIPPCR